MEPIVWVGEHKWPNYPTAEIDGIAVACEPEKFGKIEVRAFRYDVRASHSDRDLAARAVVAAVKVLRGEASPDVADAVAAERERCLAWVDWLACRKSVTYEWHSHEMEEYPNGRLFTGIRSGAPAPKEG